MFLECCNIAISQIGINKDYPNLIWSNPINSPVDERSMLLTWHPNRYRSPSVSLKRRTRLSHFMLPCKCQWGSSPGGAAAWRETPTTAAWRQPSKHERQAGGCFRLTGELVVRNSAERERGRGTAAAVRVAYFMRRAMNQFNARIKGFHRESN